MGTLFQTLSDPSTSQDPPTPGEEVRAATVGREERRESALAEQSSGARLSTRFRPVDELESSRLRVIPSAPFFAPNTFAQYIPTSWVAIFSQGSASAEGSLSPTPRQEDQ